MNQATQPVRGRGTVLTAVAIAVAVVASLALAPFASAAANPVATGSTTTITLNSGFFKKMKKNGIKVLGVSPGTVKSKTVTLPIEEGSLDVNGQGTLTHSGGIKFKHGKKTAKLSALVLDTTASSLSGKLGSKSLKIASVSGVTATRNGFGTNVAVKSLKLTGKAAKQLNKKLGFSGNKKKNKRASASGSSSLPFKGNQVLGGSSSSTQPKTIGMTATGQVALIPDPSNFAKLAEVATTLTPIAPAAIISGAPVTIGFPIGGGNIAPAGNGGVPQTLGGLKLFQNLGGGKESTITLVALWIDLTTLKATAEVTVSSTVDPKLNLGAFGRTSIADVSLAGATIKSDPAAHTVTIENASASLQATTAEVLNGVFGTPLGKAPFKAGDPLGTFSFTATTE
jgi:hypothetical protein